MHLHLDALGGVAGDMFAAALLDAAPEHGNGLRDVLLSAGLATDVDIRIERVTDEVLAGTRFVVDDPQERDALQRPHALTHGHDSHAHVAYLEIRDRIARAPLPAGTVARALDIFVHLASAEARVHGFATLDDVMFHEVGAQDSIADVLTAAHLLERCGVKTASTSSLPLGSGRIKTAHGMLPIPTPATAFLLAGMPTHDDGIMGERVTPTGAAIVRHLQPTFVKPRGVLGATGIGWGTKRFGATPNVLRAMFIDAQPQLPTFADEQTITTIAFEIDDQTSEDLAVALDHIRACEGVFDVAQIVMLGKKARMVAGVRVLCAPYAEDSVVRACLTETTTLGVRVDRVRRVQLLRSQHHEGEVHTKTVTRPDGAVTTKREIDDVMHLRSHAARMHARSTAHD